MSDQATSDVEATVVPLPRRLERYLAARGQQRLDDAAQKWEALTEREQALVREAAVMGYVLGNQAPHHRDRGDFPSDRHIVVSMLDAIDTFPDLYPTLTALGTAPPAP